ncbi:hypothetical protein GQ53DRAFT_822829 [Thozetella sp. PMI_491]|nr:hypothetical protein GQ53DRAFT_822829 [Thozetella sp. PMI_491]
MVQILYGWFYILAVNNTGGLDRKVSRNLTAEDDSLVPKPVLVLPPKAPNHDNYWKVIPLPSNNYRLVSLGNVVAEDEGKLVADVSGSAPANQTEWMINPIPGDDSNVYVIVEAYSANKAWKASGTDDKNGDQQISVTTIPDNYPLPAQYRFRLKPASPQARRRAKAQENLEDNLKADIDNIDGLDGLEENAEADPLIDV